MNQRAVQFDPDAYGDPAQALTLVIRRLTLGERVCLPNGTVVRSIAVRHGAHQSRRFAVVPEGTPLERHRALTLGMGNCKSAVEAAQKALGIKDAA